MKVFKTDFDGTEEIFPCPNMMFIYMLLDDENRCVFLGKSSSPQIKITNLVREKKFSSYKYFECCPEKADEILLNLYEKHRPRLNSIPPRNKNYYSRERMIQENRDRYFKKSIINKG